MKWKSYTDQRSTLHWLAIMNFSHSVTPQCMYKLAILVRINSIFYDAVIAWRTISYRLAGRPSHRPDRPLHDFRVGKRCEYSYNVSFTCQVFLGPLLCRSHIVTWWIWFTLATTFTIIHHSGYHLPGFPSPQFHDYHHLTYDPQHLSHAEIA